MQTGGALTANAPLNGRDFFKMALTISMPAMIQNLINTLVNSADTIMLGFVSQEAMAASSLANQLQSVLSMAFYGLVAGASVLAAQYWGRRDTDTIERVMALAIRMSLIIAALFFVAAFCFPHVVMRCFTDEEAVINEGIRYLRIIAFSYVFMGFSNIFVSVMRSVEKVVLPTVTYVVSLLTNVLINATFIFGLFGLPKLGLVGVALGTVVARFVEFLICIFYSKYAAEVKFRLSYLFKPAGVLTRDYLKVSIPSMINDLAWSLAAATYSIIMGHMGSDAVAANAVAIMALNIGAVVCRGFAGATTIIVSKELGADRRDNARLYARRMLILTGIFGAMGSLVMVAIRPIMSNMYADKLNAEALRLMNYMLLLRAVQVIGEAINTCLICGCFRGGGDAKYGMIVDSLCMWCMAVPLTLIAAYLIKLPPIWVYFVMCMDEFEKMPIFFAHYFKFKWLHNITRDKAELEGRVES